MIASLSLSEEIASEAADLREAYPKGATPHDLAGWFAQPLPRIEEALASMRADGADLSFLRQDAEKNPAAVLMGKAGGKARAAKVDAERRTEIAREAAAKRWQRIEMGKASKLASTRNAYVPGGGPDTTPAEARSILIAAIPKLAKQYPSGVIVPQLTYDLRLSEDRVRYVLKQAMYAGWCKVVRSRVEGNAGHQIYLFDGMTRCAPQLTIRQNDVYNWLLERSTKDGEVTAKMNQMCRDLGITDGTIFSHLYALEKKGRLKRLTGFNDRDARGVRISPRFEIYSEPPPEVLNLPTPSLALNADTQEVEAPAVEEAPRKKPELLDHLKAHRLSLERELERVNSMIETYFDGSPAPTVSE